MHALYALDGLAALDEAATAPYRPATTHDPQVRRHAVRLSEATCSNCRRVRDEPAFMRMTTIPISKFAINSRSHSANDSAAEVDHELAATKPHRFATATAIDCLLPTPTIVGCKRPCKARCRWTPGRYSSYLLTTSRGLRAISRAVAQFLETTRDANRSAKQEPTISSSPSSRSNSLRRSDAAVGARRSPADCRKV